MAVDFWVFKLALWKCYQKCSWPFWLESWVRQVAPKILARPSIYCIECRKNGCPRMDLYAQRLLYCLNLAKVPNSGILDQTVEKCAKIIVFSLTLQLRVRWRKKLNYECCLLGWQGLPEGPPRPRREVGQRPGDRRAEEVPRGGPAPQWTSIQIVGYLQHRTRRCRFKEWTFLHEEAF